MKHAFPKAVLPKFMHFFSSLRANYRSETGKACMSEIRVEGRNERKESNSEFQRGNSEFFPC